MHVPRCREGGYITQPPTLQVATLEKAISLIREGGRVMVTHPLGRAFVDTLKEKDPVLVPHSLPDR